MKFKINSCLKIVFLVLNTIYAGFIYSQNIDSLEKSLSKGKPDSNRVKAYNQLFLNYEYSDTTKALSCLREALVLSRKLNYKPGEALVYLNSGFSKEDFGDYDQAMIFYNKAKEVYQSLNEEYGVANCNNAMANVYKSKSMFPEALKYFNEALAYFLKSKNEKGIGSVYNNIGSVYDAEGNYEKAAEYYIKAIGYYEKLDFKLGIAASYCNLGVILQTQRNWDQAISYFNKSIKLCKEIGQPNFEGNNYNNLGDLYESKGDLKNALVFHFKALEIRKTIGDKFGMGSTLGNIGGIYSDLDSVNQALVYLNEAEKIYLELESKKFYAEIILRKSTLLIKTKQLPAAEKYVNEAIDIAKEINGNDELRKAYFIATNLYEKMGNPTKALSFSKLYIQLQDSVFSIESRKTISELEKKYQTEKKDTEISLLNKDKTLKEKEIERSNFIKNSLIVGVVMVLLLLGVSINAFLSKRKSNEIITLQKNEVEIKQKEILDSIAYAKRLQNAILPSQEYINEFLPQNFVLYKPKDIVAGDFYWMEVVEDYVFIAAADSTGHGVPGAMVSVVCSNALNRSIKEFGLRKTGEVLDKTRELVLETFAKSDSEIKDGMDISLLCVNKVKKQIMWSGANNSLCYKALNNSNELLEIKADKQSIGKSDHYVLFTTHHINFDSELMFYLFTDGFADQFGGPKGKKVMHKNFKQLLNSIAELSLIEQKEKLAQFFDEWQGTLEQVDDVSIVGVKI